MLLKRLEEPSTWAGIGVVVTQAQIFFTALPHDIGVAGIAVAAFAGIVAIIKAEVAK